MRRFPIVLLAALALSACGSAKHDTVPAADVIAAATTTQKTASERMHQDVAIEVQGESFHITADGAYDNRTHSGRTTMDLSDFARIANGELGSAADGHGEALTVKATTSYISVPTYSKLFK